MTDRMGGRGERRNLPPSILPNLATGHPEGGIAAKSLKKALLFIRNSPDGSVQATVRLRNPQDSENFGVLSSEKSPIFLQLFCSEDENDDENEDDFGRKEGNKVFR